MYVGENPISDIDPNSLAVRPSVAQFVPGVAVLLGAPLEQQHQYQAELPLAVSQVVRLESELVVRLVALSRIYALPKIRIPASS